MTASDASQRFCEQCGARLEPRARFCGACGAADGGEAADRAERRHSRRIRLLVVGAVVALLVGGIGLGAWLASGTRSGPDEAAVTIASSGGTVALDDDIVLRAPPGALPAGTTLSITRSSSERPPPDVPEGARALGDAFSIDAEGQELAQPVTVEVSFDRDLLPEHRAGDVFLAYYDEAGDQWLPVLGQVDWERNVVTVETDHVSWWQAYAWPLEALAARFAPVGHENSIRPQAAQW